MTWPRLPRAATVALALAAATAAIAQAVISTKAGLVYFVLGQVFVDGSGRLAPGSENLQLSVGEVLFTEEGRAEVLLNPGAVLRLADATRIRMDSVALTDTRVSIDAGSALLTITRPLKFDRVEISVGGATIHPTSAGMYRFDAQRPNARLPRLRVFAGQAEARSETRASSIIVKRGQSVSLQDFQLAKFDRTNKDPFERWAEYRSTPPPPSMLLPMQCWSNPEKISDLKIWMDLCLTPGSRSPNPAQK